MAQASEKPYCAECNNAKLKFRKGDRVVLSVEGCTQMPEMIKKKSAGRVTGFGRSYNLVRVLVDGTKRPDTYHAGYWQRFD